LAHRQLHLPRRRVAGYPNERRFDHDPIRWLAKGSIPVIMNAHRPARANAIALSASALVGLGMLAGCTSGGSSAASPAVTGPAAQATQAAPATRSAAPAPTMPASGLLSAAQAALKSGGSVHVDITSVAASGTVVFSDDASGSGGRQLITLDGTGHATILFIDGVGYVRADAQTLEGFFQVPQPQAVRAAGRWISLSPGEKLGSSTYDNVTAGITLSSVASELQLGASLSKTPPATVAGLRVIGVQSPLPASAGPPGAKMVLYVTDDSALRPVRYELVGGGSTKNVISFSRWGEKLSLAAPANAVPASSLTAGSVTV
jgi:hypothetical protein